MDAPIDFSLFEKRTGIIFKDKTLLMKAFTHSSFAKENPNYFTNSDHHNVENNERLEFLGDSILGFIIADYLYEKCPYSREGILTKYRDEVVRTITLAEISQNLDMDKFLLFGKGQKAEFEKGISSFQRNILADTFEAYIAAIYLDQGYLVTRDFVLKILGTRLENNMSRKIVLDSKSVLASKTQKYLKILPSYLLLDQPRSSNGFIRRVGVFFDDVCIAEGTGELKKDAEQDAARRALLTFDWPE